MYPRGKENCNKARNYLKKKKKRKRKKQKKPMLKKFTQLIW